MLRVQKTEPPKQTDKQPPTREKSPREKKSKGFLDVFLKVAEEKVNK